MLQTAPAPDSLAELDRQVQTLLDRGVPALAGLSEQALLDHVLPLRALLPARAPDGVPFVVVLTGDLLPRHEVAALLSLRGKQGFTSMDAEDLARFAPTVEAPAAPVYLATGLSTGREHLDRTPDQALPDIVAAGRQPLTLDEGLALALHHPELLKDACCCSMLGSRCGDRRVTAVWLSKGRPRLGWCYAGAPHTWLGSGWLTERLASRQA
ncbi:MAG: hypothetical protein JWN08_1832 [Frankiales bacterium]|nr:hypothetical protein [Frankiales bacterium]